MADITADLDWVDCNALRRDAETGGNRQRERGDSVNDNAWQPTGLRLIEPDGSERLIGDAAAAAEATEAKRQAEAQAHKVQQEAEALARRQAEAKAAALAKAEAEERARKDAEAKALAEEQARKEAAAKAEAEAKKREAEEQKAREEAERKAKAEAEKKAKAEAERKALQEAEAKAKAAEEAKAKAEAKARLEAEELAKAEAKAKAKAERKAKAEAEKKAKAEAEEKARVLAEKKAKEEAERKAKAEAKEKAKQEAEAKAAAEKKAKEDAERKAKEIAERKAREAAEKKARVEAEAKAKAKAEAEKKAQAEAEKQAKAEAEEAARQEALKTGLGQTFRRLIRETGPISLAQYMGESNARYYASRDPLGAEGKDDGDFITAPEISQMFGELIGLWLADVWVKMGASDNIHYVELGPGRGTLAKDVLKTAGKYGFNPHVHFVEGSRELRKVQRQAVPHVRFHDDLSTIPEDRPLLIVANEFFDALPIHQLIRAADEWRERMVGLEGDELAFVAGDKPMDSIVPPSWRSASQGSMIETSPAAASVMGEIAQRLASQGGVALVIDYGPSELRAGSTLQALKDHTKVDPLACPGEADLTAHVDFEMLQQVAEKHGAEVMGLQMQGEWLRQLHIDTRLEALKRQSPRLADQLQRQRDRLVEDDQMGALFKVLGICGRRWPHGEGFA